MESKHEGALDGLIRQHELLGLLGMSRVTLWKWRKAGAFPQPVRLVGASVAWRRSDVRAWLESRPTVGSQSGAA